MSDPFEHDHDDEDWARGDGYLLLPSDLAFTALGFIAAVFEAAANAATELQEAAGRHIDYRRNQEDFQRDAGRELESLINPKQEES